METSDETRPPNIVLIMVDDQGWGDLSLNGNPVVNTPNIDSLAQNGLQFEHFYVNSVCSPTRAALLTGRYAVRGGVYSTSAGGERLDLDETTFATCLQNAGYRTGAFGKWHNGMQPPYHPNARGFDTFYGYCSGHWGSYFDAILEHNGKIVQSEGYLTDVLTEKAMDFIETHQDEAFFVYLPLNTPHSPMQVPDKWWQKFEHIELPKHRYSELEDSEHTRAAYAMAENIDWNVGRVAEKLEQLDLSKNTLIVYLSDNGPNGWRWNGNMEGIKGSTNEGGVRTICTMTWPEKIQAAKRITQIASVMDIFPTLLDFADIETDAEKLLDGRSLKPLILDEGAVWEERTIVNHWRDRTSVRTQNFRLDEKNQLFDMRIDLSQTKDVQTEYPEVYAQLTNIKAEWLSEVLTELPQEDSRPFPLGDPNHIYTQLPARDAMAHGNIERSNRWPNCSFYTNWISKKDSLSWEVEVLEAGLFEVGLYYTCQSENVGVEMSLSDGKKQIAIKIDKAHDPALRGAEHDRIPRGESYVKDFALANMGQITLEKGLQTLSLLADDITGNAAIDFRMLTFKRLAK